MTISLQTITGSIKKPDNSDAQITKLVFTLSSSDFENGEIVAVNTVEADVNPENGDFTATLWPNDMGMGGKTTYSMAFTFADNSSVPTVRQIYVKKGIGPKTIEEVIFETEAALKLAPNAIALLSRTQYNLLTTKQPNTAYFIKKVA